MSQSRFSSMAISISIIFASTSHGFGVSRHRLITTVLQSSASCSRLFSTIRKTNYESSGMPILPPGLVKYAQVPQKGNFTSQKIPVGLLKDHSTKAGTWGVIRVHRGELQYSIQEPSESIHNLSSIRVGIIEPTKLHHVFPLTQVMEFVVEFHRLEGTGPVNEQREGYSVEKT